MNIVLFEPGEETRPLAVEDPRGRHIVHVLGAVPGQAVRAGIVDGPRGSIVLRAVTASRIDFDWREEPPETEASPGTSGRLSVLLGHPRPPVLRRLAKDLTTIGVRRILFVRGALTEKSYLSSKVWEPGAMRATLLEGASQGGATDIPEVLRFSSLKRALEDLGSEGRLRVLLDPEAEDSLFSLRGTDPSCPGSHDLGGAVLAVGPERGWTEDERRQLLEAGFRAVDLGPRILRTETAALVGATFLAGFLRMQSRTGTEQEG